MLETQTQLATQRKKKQCMHSPRNFSIAYQHRIATNKQKNWQSLVMGTKWITMQSSKHHDSRQLLLNFRISLKEKSSRKYTLHEKKCAKLDGEQILHQGFLYITCHRPPMQQHGPNMKNLRAATQTQEWNQAVHRSGKPRYYSIHFPGQK